MNTLEVQCLDIVAGMLNKQTAAGPGVAEKTMRFHRAHIMRKMRAESVAELVRMAAQPAAEATKA